MMDDAGTDARPDAQCPMPKKPLMLPVTFSGYRIYMRYGEGIKNKEDQSGVLEGSCVMRIVS